MSNAADAVTAFQPPERLLCGPGPSDVAPEVLQAMAQPTIGHLDPRFVGMMDEIKTLLRTVMCTDNALTFPVSGPGSVGMEAAFVNLLECGDKAIICINGVFGGRMKTVAERCGATVVTVDNDWGEPVDVDAVEAALKANPDARVLGFVHAETSTGARSDARAIAALAQQYGVLSIADCVTSLGGIELRLDDWGLDAVYSGTQKCLSCPPGLSPVSFSQRAVERVQARNSPVQSWFLDLGQVMAYWSGDGKRSYHHTAPVNALYGLHEALRRVVAEGLDAAWARHRAAHEQLVAGLADMGLEMLVAAESRLPQLNSVVIPEGVDDAAVRTALLETHGIEIGAGLGPLAGKVWRIGLMGESARPEKVDRVLAALRAEVVATA